MVVMNTFNHTAEHPRFRVVIPTTGTMPPEVYSILQNQIASKLEEAGYSVKKDKSRTTVRPNTLRSGLDLGKQSPASLFLLPCQAEGSKHGFFRYYDDGGREFLDPTIWVENGPRGGAVFSFALPVARAE